MAAIVTPARCYVCGRLMLDAEAVAMDIAPARQAFAEPVLVHQHCSPSLAGRYTAPDTA
jgi:hypothetical protein